MKRERFIVYRRLLASLVFACSGSLISAQDMQTIFGPRIGVSYTGVSEGEYNQSLSPFFPGGTYVPVNSVFAASLEQRFKLGETEHHLGIQEVFSVGGMEQSLFIPSFS